MQIIMERTITNPTDRAARLKRLYEFVTKRGRSLFNGTLNQAKADWLKFGPAYEDDFRHKNQPSRPRTRRRPN